MYLFKFFSYRKKRFFGSRQDRVYGFLNKWISGSERLRSEWLRSEWVEGPHKKDSEHGFPSMAIKLFNLYLFLPLFGSLF